MINNNKNNNNELGDSLLEVIISTVIMGIIGVLLVSSVASARPFADKMSLVGQSVQNLNSLEESINLQPYTACSPANTQPYAFAVPSSRPAPISSAFGIENIDLPPAMVSTATKSHPYFAQLVASNAAGPVTWRVEPLLPAGLTLDSKTGVISGTTPQPITAAYDFTATEANTSVIKSLLLTSSLVEVLENDGSAWVPCENIPVDSISQVVGDGATATYYYSGPQVNIGSVIAVWGTNNKSFEGSALTVTNADGQSFTVNNQNIGTAVGGYSAFATAATVQQVVVSTVVSGSPFHIDITKAMP